MTQHDPTVESRPSPEHKLGAQRIAQYVTRGRCERYLRFGLFPSEARMLFDRFRLVQEPLSPLLASSGRSFEREQVDRLRESQTVRDMNNRPSSEFIAAVAAQSEERVFYDQPQLEGSMGPWACEGRADLIAVERGPGGVVDVTIVDIKASRRDMVGYRLQVAFYSRLLRPAFAAAGIAIGVLRGAVAASDADVSSPDLETFDLGLFEDEVERLAALPGSDVERVVAKTFDELTYRLGPACDGCPYNAACFVDSAEREDLSLVPHLTATEKSGLLSEGVTSVRQLAGLMDYGDAVMVPASGRAADLERIGDRWPLGSRLPVLVQRARAALRRLDRGVEAKPYLLGSDYGSLPDDTRYPGLVKVFVDAQRDYLEDRVYMLSSLVAGPAGTEEIVDVLDAPPDTAAERALLVRWTQRLLPAISRVAGAESAPLHVYLFDRRGQRSLLDALARHFDALCAIPAFHDLLTSSPALTQGMVSFLADDVRDRQNLNPICQNLYQTATEMGFRWESEHLAARSTFKARVFDNRRPYERDAATGRFRIVAETGPSTLWVEASARFGVEIPLEYAYAAWGIVRETPDMQARAIDQIRGFLGVTLDDLRALGGLRCRALKHVEAKFPYKNRRVEKLPLDLVRLDQVEVEPGEIPFRRTLEAFLLLEHHAARQEALLRLSLPPAMRAETGRSATLLCTTGDDQSTGLRLATFSFCAASGEPVELADLGTLRFKEGDWCVLNPIEEDGEPLPGWKLPNGRLVVIEEIDATRVTLRLMPMNFRNSQFRYGHRLFTPEPGAIYTIDEMLDDFNADKFLEACRNATSNHLYRWIEDPDLGMSPRSIRPKRLREAEEIAELAARAQAPLGLTDAQRSIIGGRLGERVLVVQGPPGTGKSHTLGFAVLVRALALATPVRPFRIAVLAKTHAATLVALDSVVKRARQLRAFGAGDARFAPLDALRVIKICNDETDVVPEGVERVLADGSEGVKAPQQWHALMNEPLLVVGATPGGFFNLVKRGAGRGKSVDWSQSYFDLVVVDEASQMGIAEALTAAAFLREDGQFVAIGDHRQMPPILAHAWDRESRRELSHARPHLAIFDYLRELGFSTAALDESFRIPAEVAEFLQRHVYAQDGIDFRSRNRERLAAVSGLDGWLAAAMAPEHPFVVIEHTEVGSQQYNEFEAGLCEQIVQAACGQLGLDSATGIGIVVPHSAQRALLRRRLPQVADAVDTVERFQGGERELIVVSATVSDRDYAQRESAFLLEPRRLTVAVSRPKRKLIVIASRSMFDLIPEDLDEYERGALWKQMLRECGGPVLAEATIDGHMVRVRSLSAPVRS